MIPAQTPQPFPSIRQQLHQPLLLIEFAGFPRESVDRDRAPVVIHEAHHLGAHQRLEGRVLTLDLVRLDLRSRLRPLARNGEAVCYSGRGLAAIVTCGTDSSRSLGIAHVWPHILQRTIVDLFRQQ